MSRAGLTDLIAGKGKPASDDPFRTSKVKVSLAFVEERHVSEVLWPLRIVLR